MKCAPEVTDEHMARAYAQLRRPDWPTLHELRMHYLHFSTIRARAVALAHGRAPAIQPPEPAAVQAPAPAAPAAAPQRRRVDAPPPGASPYSPRMAAAGEYIHEDDA